MSGKANGGIVESQMHKPSVDGAIVYLNANPNIQSVIDRVEKAGGKVVMPKTQISPEIGYMAFFTDTEGNKVGLHAQINSKCKAQGFALLHLLFKIVFSRLPPDACPYWLIPRL